MSNPSYRPEGAEMHFGRFFDHATLTAMDAAVEQIKEESAAKDADFRTAKETWQRRHDDDFDLLMAKDAEIEALKALLRDGKCDHCPTIDTANDLEHRLVEAKERIRELEARLSKYGTGDKPDPRDAVVDAARTPCDCFITNLGDKHDPVDCPVGIALAALDAEGGKG